MLDQHHQEVEEYTETGYYPGLCRRGRSLYTQYQERHCQGSPGNTIISQEMINELMDINRNMTYRTRKSLDAATQEYKIDNQYQIDPVGIQCNHLEGIFLNILWRKNFYNNINTCFENANIPIAEMYLAPLAMADSVLTDSEKRAGCMLVDLGADTTTVSVYYKGILRHLCHPIGRRQRDQRLNLSSRLKSLMLKR